MEPSTPSVMSHPPKQSIANQTAYASLKRYLKEVSSLEVQAFVQSRLLSTLTSQANALGRAGRIDKPQKPSFSTGTYSSVGNFWRNLCFVLSFSCLIMTGLVILAGVGWERYVILSGCIIFALLGCIPGYIQYISDGHKYNSSMEKYRHSLRADADRIKYEQKIKAEIERQIGCVKSELSKTKQSLSTLYSLGVLHKDYQHDLVAVCSFYDYFDKSICTRLTGFDGAYKFYEEERRLRRIETRLDVIIDKLDEIISNQHQLGSLIREGNATISRIEKINRGMSATLDNVQRNTAVAEYNTRCAAQSAAVMENIAIYRTLRDY